mmetsp:Transcript_7108/g.8207  ORF Transcript_7108/g.8207 Transcript_7108/m.8207 type:complete len:80 (-) Transcript_7108:90-329(-)
MLFNVSFRFSVDCGPSAAGDRGSHSATVRQLTICRIRDGIDNLSCDVVLDNFDAQICAKNTLVLIFATSDQCDRSRCAF